MIKIDKELDTMEENVLKMGQKVVRMHEKVVQAFNHEDEALEQFDEINDRLQKCSLRATFFSSLNQRSGSTLFGAAVPGCQ